MPAGKDRAAGQLRDRYWLAGTAAPRWVPVVWNRRAATQPWWVRLWLRWSA